MPTSLHLRQSHREPEVPARRDPGWRDVMVAGTVLLGVLVLICEQRLGPTSGYSLVADFTQLQLSP